MGFGPCGDYRIWNIGMEGGYCDMCDGWEGDGMIRVMAEVIRLPNIVFPTSPSADD